MVEGGEGEGLLIGTTGKGDVDNRAASASSATGDGDGDLGGGGGDLRRPRGSGEIVRAGDGEIGFRWGVEGMLGGVVLPLMKEMYVLGILDPKLLLTLFVSSVWGATNSKLAFKQLGTWGL